MNHLQRNIQEATRVFETLSSLEGKIDDAARLVGRSLISGHKLLACGNGGSAADAAHFTTEFVCRFDGDRPPYPALCLATHGGDLTAIGNDYEFNDIFARQVAAFAQPGDVLLCFTTSGNSENVLRALCKASEVKIDSIAFLGRDGGGCRGIATIDLIVEDNVTARIQEAHKLLLHTLCEIVEGELRLPRG